MVIRCQFAVLRHSTQSSLLVWKGKLRRVAVVVSSIVTSNDEDFHVFEGANQLLVVMRIGAIG